MNLNKDSFKVDPNVTKEYSYLKQLVTTSFHFIKMLYQIIYKNKYYTVNYKKFKKVS